MSKEKQSLFEQLMRVGYRQELGPDYLEKCMSFDSHLDKKVPLRYRLIALGFIKHYTLEQLNQKLMQNNCEKLYSRNIWEAGLIYAFLKKMPYDRWKEIEKETETVMENHSLLSPWFQGNGITFDELKKYVEASSDQSLGMLQTRHLTRELSNKLREAADEDRDFSDFLLQNISEFSVSREKARYYFCKYLYYFLKTKMDGYLADMRSGSPAKENHPADDMNVFVGMATQRRKKCTPEEMKSFMEKARISCGEIFDGFNEFYFNYVTLNWMEVLLEYYGDIDHLPDDDREYLAESLRHYHKELKGFSDEEVLRTEKGILEEREKKLDKEYSLFGNSKGYQRGRQGENTIRKYIRGELDIDRVSLLFYLLYFGYFADLPTEYRISRERLSDILSECGYARLREDDDFDSFVIQFLKADDPVSYLMDTVTSYALDEENFFLYKVFQASRNEDEMIQKLIGKKKDDGKDKKEHKKEEKKD